MHVGSPTGFGSLLGVRAENCRLSLGEPNSRSDVVLAEFNVSELEVKWVWSCLARVAILGGIERQRPSQQRGAPLGLPRAQERPMPLAGSVS